MKKTYIQPNTETVKVRLNGSIMLDEVNVGGVSEFTNKGLGKENDFDWEDNDDGDMPHNINLWDD